MLHQHSRRSKCLFDQPSVEYLRHVISQQGLSVDSSKITTIQQWPPPKNVKEVRSFLGLASYYCRFIHHYASIAGPLTDLLRKESFRWNTATQDAYETLKAKLSITPVLVLRISPKSFN